MNDEQKRIPLPLDAVRHRYLNDATFHVFVDVCRRAIQEMQLTPGEVREAAMLACIIEEERRPMPPFKVTP